MSGVTALLALGLFAAGSAVGQVPGPAQPDAAGRVAARKPATDAEVEAQRVRSEARLKRREDQARRTLRGICNGC